MSVGILVSKQNRDGGWPYVRGGSWTEPTVYAVLALLAAGEKDSVRRGLSWIVRAQQPDGGWPPRNGIDQSTWVTGLVALLPPEQLGAAAHARAVAWLLATTGKESETVYRLREWLLGVPQSLDQRYPGWPWVPGTAAWVSPTSIAMLALEQQYRRQPSRAVQRRIEEGRGFLVNRMCKEGGWNHGSVRPLGYESRPYPETTGMALAALRGVNSVEVDRALDTAKRFLANCRSADGLSWLQLGLAAHGQLPAGYCRPPSVEAYTLHELSLAMMVATPEPGRGLFWT